MHCWAGSVDMAVFQSKHLQTNTKSFSVVVGSGLKIAGELFFGLRKKEVI